MAISPQQGQAISTGEKCGQRDPSHGTLATGPTKLVMSGTYGASSAANRAASPANTKAVISSGRMLWICF